MSFKGFHTTSGSQTIHFWHKVRDRKKFAADSRNQFCERIGAYQAAELVFWVWANRNTYPAVCSAVETRECERGF